jgi:4-aminobutyrate aminotransferase
MPEGLTRFFFANSGSEAVENAIKIARGHTKKQNIICFEVSGATFCGRRAR